MDGLCVCTDRVCANIPPSGPASIRAGRLCNTAGAHLHCIGVTVRTSGSRPPAKCTELLFSDDPYARDILCRITRTGCFSGRQDAFRKGRWR